MKKKSELFNTVEFVKFKADVIQIVSQDDWKKAAAMYTTRYRNYAEYRGGIKRLNDIMEAFKHKTHFAPASSVAERAKALNAWLMKHLRQLKADGFKKENVKEYKAIEIDIKEYTLDGDEPPKYGKKRGTK